MKNIILILFLLGLSGQVLAQTPDVKKQTNLKVATVKKFPAAAKITIKNKIEYLKNLDEYRREHNVPEDFPRFIDTGNPKKDLDNYYKAKQEWIRQHPGEFEKIKNLNL